MLRVETRRLLLVPTPLEVMQERLIHSDFDAYVPWVGNAGSPGPVETLRVHFPHEWPGPDALEAFPVWIARRQAHPDAETWDGVIVRRDDRVAVGGMGFKYPPDPAGRLELGYGIGSSYRNRGYATEMASAAAEWALDQEGVRSVVAECLRDNAASIRVLEKVGFAVVGTRSDEEGDLLVWELVAR